MQTRTRDSRHEYVASPLCSSCIFHRVFFALLFPPTCVRTYVYVLRPILRDHVCVRAAAIQISPLGYTSLQTDTARVRSRTGGVNAFLPRRFFLPATPLQTAIRIFEYLLVPLLLHLLHLLSSAVETRLEKNGYPTLSISIVFFFFFFDYAAPKREGRKIEGGGREEGLKFRGFDDSRIDRFATKGGGEKRVDALATRSVAYATANAN